MYCGMEEYGMEMMIEKGGCGGRIEIEVNAFRLVGGSRGSGLVRGGVGGGLGMKVEVEYYDD